jgi:hypothetical protein
MENSKDTGARDGDTDDVPVADEGDRAVGDVLGVSRVTPSNVGNSREAPREPIEPGDEEANANQPPVPRERTHVGSRDVTDGTTGGTGPDTGGTGVFRRGSGATGTDIGR